MKSDSFVFSYTGGRPYNEDCAQIKESENQALFVVADGLGGHQHGELASNRVVKVLCDAFPPKPDTEISDWLEETLKKAQDEVTALQEETDAAMRTTVITLIINGDKAYWAHIGDSRLYYIGNSEIKRITEDHSVAYKKYKAGEIFYDEIALDEDQSRLLRAIGSERNTPALDSSGIKNGDGFLLCSDGKWEYIRQEEILVDFLKSDSARQWGELMLMRVMERQPEDCDNLSLITVFV